MSLYKGVVHLSVSSRVRELEKEKGIQARQITVHFPPKTDLGISRLAPASIKLYKIEGNKVRKEGLVGDFRQTDTHGIWATSQAEEAREAHKALFDSVRTVEKGDKSGTAYYAIYEKAAVATGEDVGNLDINLD
jgi:hypothetical protein